MDVTHQRPQDMDPTSPSPAKPFRAGSDDAGGTPTPSSTCTIRQQITKCGVVQHDTRIKQPLYCSLHVSESTSVRGGCAAPDASIVAVLQPFNLRSTTLARRTSNCTGAKGC